MSSDALPVRYEANKKAMLTPLMEDWLKELDRKMRAQNKKNPSTSRQRPRSHFVCKMTNRLLFLLKNINEEYFLFSFLLYAIFTAPTV